MNFSFFKNKENAFGIQSKLNTTISRLLIISLGCLGLIAVIMNYLSTNNLLKQTFSETVKVAASKAGYELETYTNVVTELGCDSVFADSSTTDKQKKEIIDQKVKTYDLERGNILGTDGISIFDGNDYSKREYFKAAMKGDTFVSDPLVSKITGDLTIIRSAEW